MINRYELVTRHNPILKEIDYNSPLTVGNGELAFTADITGMQTLYDSYKEKHFPLCTMSQWGWHTTPASQEKYSYNLNDVGMTTYDFYGREVNYAVECKKGNEEVYHWLRHNPHRFHLGKICFVYQEKEIRPFQLSNIYQKLDLYDGKLESEFWLDGEICKVITVCHHKKDTLAFQMESLLFKKGLKVRVAFPYGHHDISGSDWESVDKHQTKVIRQTISELQLERNLNKDYYYVTIHSDSDCSVKYLPVETHSYDIESKRDHLNITVNFSREITNQKSNTLDVIESSKNGWNAFWQSVGIVDLHQSKDSRAMELERRIILSHFLLAIQSSGSLPPQETGLTCNSWYGKFHLEMHPWHSMYMPLFHCGELLENSLNWYEKNLIQAKENAKKNGYQGARWPKMVAFDGIDSPSTIATLLIWQQPHIIYMLETLYKSGKEIEFLYKYWYLVKETADFMCDFVVFNPKTKKFDLSPPIIPAQEEHKPTDTINPTFELEYWRFTLNIAIKWAKRLNKSIETWQGVSENMADLPVKDGLYLAHQNSPTTFTEYNKDHPSMLLAYGFLPSDRVNKEYMKNTLLKVMECWDFSTMWGWDFAFMSMTAIRLGEPEIAIDILLKDTPKNSYVTSGNNYQKLRNDLPLYLPGNGSLLLCMAMMLMGYGNCEEKYCGLPKNGMWEIEVENIAKLPY